jgi:hypothetical protein
MKNPACAGVKLPGSDLFERVSTAPPYRRKGQDQRRAPWSFRAGAVSQTP